MKLLSRSEILLTTKLPLTMNTLTKQEIVDLGEPESLANLDDSNSVESLTVPIGTFSGSQDRMIRIRNGKPVPANTGDQGGGQN